MLYNYDILLQQEPYPKYATVYLDDSIVIDALKASILYFHGGGLLFGSRNDLPMLYLQTLTNVGYAIICFDYPLAPEADLPLIYQDILDSINDYINNPLRYIQSKMKSSSTTSSFSTISFLDSSDSNASSSNKKLPYFLWGRSAGAYLCLLAAAKGELHTAANGLLSYYGYGFLTDEWFLIPSPFYTALPKAVMQKSDDSDLITCQKELSSYYSNYIYARQTGKWIESFFHDKQKYFFLNYTLKTIDQLTCPLFSAHSMHDTDVPFAESTALATKYHATRYIASIKEHDFDRDEASTITKDLLHKTLDFLSQNL